MKTFILSFVILLVGTLILTADPICRVVRPSGTSYAAPVQAVKAHRQIVQVVQVAQINPAYTSAYAPDGYDSATQADLLAEVKRLSALVSAQNRLATTPPSLTPTPPVTAPPATVPVPQTKGAGLTGLQVFATKCAACHQAGKLAPEQRFTLLDQKGSLSQLTAQQKLRVLTRVYSGTMPPPTNIYAIPAVTDAEYSAIVDILSGP